MTEMKFFFLYSDNLHKDAFTITKNQVFFTIYSECVL